jgi:hypothetical protein
MPTNDPATDLVAACACVACYLADRPIHGLHEAGRLHDFGGLWLSTRQLCVWDADRAAYLHVGRSAGHWQLFDVATGRTLRIERTGQQFTFTDDGVPVWFERVAVDLDEVHASGPDGEHCYVLSHEPPPSRAAARTGAR